jgi:hypothetical protein
MTSVTDGFQLYRDRIRSRRGMSVLRDSLPKAVVRFGSCLPTDFDLARHPGELLCLHGDLVLRDIELHCKEGVVTNDSCHVDNSLRT